MSDNDNTQKVFTVVFTPKGQISVQVLAKNHVEAFDKVREMSFREVSAVAETESMTYDNMHLGEISDPNFPYPLSDNQFRFVQDAEEQGFEIQYTYSGRGMYGKVCPAVSFSPSEEEQLVTSANYCEDSMGLGVVYYARW